MTRALLCVTAAAALGLPGAPARAQGQQEGTTLLVETFKEATAPEFTGFGKACLSGAPLADEPLPPLGDHPLGGCDPLNIPGINPGPVPPANAAPHGYLRLTDAWHDRSAAVMYNRPLPANGGLDVTFDAWQYGSTRPEYPPADGISFFLSDGATTLDRPGAFGGSLGYAKKLPDANTSRAFEPGVAGGYLGVGMDVFGNYFADTEWRGYGCENQPSPTGHTLFNALEHLRGPNMITVRGPGNGTNGYCYITATSPDAHSTTPSRYPWPSSLDQPPINGTLQGPFTNAMTMPTDAQEAEAALEPSRRHFNVRLTPTPNPRLIVSVNFFNGTGPHQVLNIPAPQPVPPTYKFGFAASTGGATDVHLIRNVIIASDHPLHELNLVKQVLVKEIDGQERRPAALHVGQVLTYQYVVTNAGQDTITDLKIPDQAVEGSEVKVIGPVTCPTTTLKPLETITCTAPYTVTGEDFERGYIANEAKAYGIGEADGEPVESPPDTERIPTQGLSISKVATEKGFSTPGTVLHYTYTVTNTGDVPLYNVVVHDDTAEQLNGCEWDMLPPAPESGFQRTCTGTYTTKEKDLVAGGVTNVAHVAATLRPDGTEPLTPEPEDTATVPAEVLSLSCPDWAPSINGEQSGVWDIQGQREGSVTLPVGECSVTDFRAENAGGGQWTIAAAMNTPFCYTPPGETQWCIPNDNVHYVIPSYTVTKPTTTPATELNNLAPEEGTEHPPGVILRGPAENTAANNTAKEVETPEGGWTAPTGEPVLETGTNAPLGPVYEAHWTPDLVVTIPPNAPLTTPESPHAEYLGTITYTVI